MNIQHSTWTHTGLAFGVGLAFVKPWLLLMAIALSLAALGSWQILRLISRHWPGLRAFLTVATDFIMLLLILCLLLGVLWLMPAFLPPG